MKISSNPYMDNSYATVIDSTVHKNKMNTPQSIFQPIDLPRNLLSRIVIFSAHTYKVSYK